MEETIGEKINRLWSDGKTYKEICGILNISRHSVAYHLTSKGRRANERKKVKEEADKELLEKIKGILKECNSYSDVCRTLGFKVVPGYVKKITTLIQKNKLDTSHFGKLDKPRFDYKSWEKIPNEEYFKENTSHNGQNIIKRLLRIGWESKCEHCKRSEWEGQPMPLQLHHRNGNHFDNRLENLEILCPNCHALTDTYGCSKKQREKLATNDNNKKFLVSTFCDKKMEEKEIEIEKQELLQLFKRFKSFVGVGKYLKISDNGVRKRCKKLGILEDVLQIKKTNS